MTWELAKSKSRENCDRPPVAGCNSCLKPLSHHVGSDGIWNTSVCNASSKSFFFLIYLIKYIRLFRVIGVFIMDARQLLGATSPLLYAASRWHFECCCARQYGNGLLPPISTAWVSDTKWLRHTLHFSHHQSMINFHSTCCGASQKRLSAPLHSRYTPGLFSSTVASSSSPSHR